MRVDVKGVHLHGEMWQTSTSNIYIYTDAFYPKFVANLYIMLSYPYRKSIFRAYIFKFSQHMLVQVLNHLCVLNIHWLMF